MAESKQAEIQKRKAFETEALPHMDALYRTAHRLTGRPEEAEDLVQETFLKAFRSFHQFTPGTNCRAWLYKILRNTLATRHEKRGRDPVGGVPLDDVEPFLGAEDPDLGLAPETYEALLGRVLEDDVRDALMALPEAYRAAVILADLESLPYREIAEVMDVPIGTVMSRLFRGRRALRGQLLAAARRHGIAAGAGEG